MKSLSGGAVLIALVLSACGPADVPVGDTPSPTPTPTPTPSPSGNAPARPHLPQAQLPGNVVAPSSTWLNVTTDLANLPSECGNLTLVSADPWSPRIIAGVAQRGLYKSDNGGGSWQPLGTGSGSATITNRPSAIVYDADDPNRFWESGIYNGGGTYVTLDRGSTFQQLGSIAHNDLISVDMHDAQRKTLLAGGHEQVQTVHRSINGGTNWTNVGANLPVNSNHSSYPLVLDSDSYLVGACGWASGACGVWRTQDGGATWTASLSALSPGGAPLWHSSGAIYWPLIYGSGLAVSTDLGVTWDFAAAGVYSPVELPDGRMLGLAGGRVVLSSDGHIWTPVGQPLPFQAAGLTYSAWTKTMYVWQWDCGNVVLPNAIARAGFDYQ
jgi:hypothetical protein